MHKSISLDIKTSVNIYFLSFNQTNTCFCIGTDEGYEIYKTNPIEREFKTHVPPNGVSYITILNETNIIAYIKKDNTFEKKEEKNVIIYNISAQKIVGLLKFSDIVRYILFNMGCIAISLNDSIYLYSLYPTGPEIQYKIDIPAISRGLCAITPIVKNKFYISTIGEEVGTIQLWGFSINKNKSIINTEKPNTKLTSSLLLKKQEEERKEEENNSNHPTKQQINLYNSGKIIKKNTIYAHQTHIRFMVFSQDGKYIATCSQRGTLIRIYNVFTRKIVKELRRGTEGAVINWISFSKDNAFLLCRNKKGTIHIFHTDYDENRKKNNKMMYITGYINKYVPILKSYMPKYIDSEWSFIQFNLDVSTIAAFSNIEPYTIIGIGFNGIIYKLNYNNPDHITVIKQPI